METVITAIATTNAQTSLLRLSDSSANRVSTAANRVSTAANCFLSELLAELRELDVHLGVEFDESGLCLELKVCQVTFRGQLLPSSRWLLCHKELRNHRDRGEWLTGITVSPKPFRNTNSA